MANHYEVPSWAGKPPTGQHLDVSKDEKLIQKLMIDEKKCYLFGRNPHMNDFCIDHGSCSRVHAALVYHKHLNISYLVDLGSTHGTFIGNLQIESQKPTQLQMNSTFHFGASTRYYTLRERPVAGSRNTSIMEDIPMNESADGALLGLPESQTELDNLTEYNTAHNRRISMLGITDDTNIKKISHQKSKRKRRGVTFNDEEIVINPEDIDPAVGRFRNLIQTTVVPTKKLKFDTYLGSSVSGGGGGGGGGSANASMMPPPAVPSHQNAILHHHNQPSSFMPHLYHDLPPSSTDHDANKSDSDVSTMMNLGSKLGLILPNPAPDVAPTSPTKEYANVANRAANFGQQNMVRDAEEHTAENSNEPKKKKYAKEAWPGRKPLLSSF